MPYRTPVPGVTTAEGIRCMRKAPANIPGDWRLSRQYWEPRFRSLVSSLPVTDEKKSVEGDGSFPTTDGPISARYCSPISAMWYEWYALSTCSSLASTSGRVFLTCATTARTASASPEMVTLLGELSHAMVTVSSCPTRSFSASSQPSPRAAMAPSRFCSVVTAPRWCAARIASPAPSAPAAYAAAISPLEWPTTARGTTPTARSVSTSAICTAVHSGCDSSADDRRLCLAGLLSSSSIE